MIKNIIQLRIFIGYQVNSRFHSPEDFHKMGEELENHLYNQNQPVELIIEYGEFAPGTQLWGQILEKITSSDISIFDISENNPNVLLEVGISFGSDKQVILLKKKETNKRYPTPSDLRAFVYIPYNSADELYQNNLCVI